MSRLRPKVAALLGVGLAASVAWLAPTPSSAATPVVIQVLGTNDFHGRILNNTSNGEAGAAVLAGAVKQLRTENPNTVFAAAGDLIGASTFESFIANDVPTIDALNEAGLEVSAVGNHELDLGYRDLVDRVLPLADWEYIAANIDDDTDPTTPDAIAESWTQTFGDITVGFVGAVTEDLPSLVSPAGIATITVDDIVTSVNAEAAALGTDVVVLLVHEGAANTSLAATTDPSTAWGAIVNGLSTDIDAVISGHTHLAYNHAVTGLPGRTLPLPVVSAGQYGTNLNQLLFTVDDDTDTIMSIAQNILALESAGDVPNYPADPATAGIANAAKAAAETLGAQELGFIAGAFNRAQLANGNENRGGESTLGNLVAEVHRDATGADIAFMNPGGLRADMVGNNTGGYPAALTYKQAAVVQPFANTLVELDMTGAQIKTVLEQQWQRDAQGAVPSRPFLRLGVSAGFEYTYDPALPEGSRITGMWLNDSPIVATDTYSVAVNSFLGAGGDNFRGFSAGTNKVDTGQSDLTAMVEYMAAFPDSANALARDTSQHAVGVTFPPGSGPYYPNGPLDVNLSSLAMSTSADLKDTQVVAWLGSDVLGTFPVDNTIGTTPFDESGTASVNVILPSDITAGSHVLRVVGNRTGTEITIPFTATTTVPATDPVLPARLLDTRSGDQFVTADGDFQGIGPVAAGDRIELDVAGRGGVPTNATSVLLNVTAVSPEAAGHLTVYPCGTARPNASSVNYAAGQTVPNAVLAKLGTGGRVCIYSRATTDVIVDVNAFVPVGGALAGVNPARLADTRTGALNVTTDNLFQGGGRIAAEGVLELTVGGRGNVPGDASSVLLNVTAVAPAANGHLTVYPCGTTRPLAANVNYLAGEVRPNAVIAKLGTDGKVCIYTRAATDLVVDVNGFVPAGGGVTAISPARFLDTRPGGAPYLTIDGANQGEGTVAAETVYELEVVPRDTVTPSASAVFLNVTAVLPEASGYLTVFNCDDARPVASNVNYLTGQVVPNMVLAEVSSEGTVCIFTKATTHIVADVNAFLP